MGCQSFPLSTGDKASVKWINPLAMFQLQCCFKLLIQACLYASASLDLPDRRTCLQSQVQHYLSYCVYTSSQSLVKWKLELSGLLLFPDFDSCLYIIHINMSVQFVNISTVGFPANLIFMADLLYVKYLTSLKKKTMCLICVPVTSCSPPSGKCLVPCPGGT